MSGGRALSLIRGVVRGVSPAPLLSRACRALLRVPEAAFCGVLGGLGDGERRGAFRVGLDSLATAFRDGGLLGGGCFDADEVGRFEALEEVAGGRDEDVRPLAEAYGFFGGLSWRL